MGRHCRDCAVGNLEKALMINWWTYFIWNYFCAVLPNKRCIDSGHWEVGALLQLIDP